MIQSFNRGEVYWYDFGDYSDDKRNRIYHKRRPVVIVSNDLGNHNSGIVTIAPITSKPRQKEYPFQVMFKNGQNENVICLEQCRTINNYELLNYIGKLDEVTMKKVDIALSIALDLPIADENKTEAIFLEHLDYRLSSIIKNKFKNYNFELNEVKTEIGNIVSQLKDVENLLFNLCKMNMNVTDENKEKSNIKVIKENNDDDVNVIINKEEENKKNEKLIKNQSKDGRRYKVTNEEMIEFLNLYNELTMDDMCELFNCDAKRIANLRYRYMQNLKKQNINVEMKNKRHGKSHKGDKRL